MQQIFTENISILLLWGNFIMHLQILQTVGIGYLNPQLSSQLREKNSLTIYSSNNAKKNSLQDFYSIF